MGLPSLTDSRGLTVLREPTDGGIAHGAGCSPWKRAPPGYLGRVPWLCRDSEVPPAVVPGVAGSALGIIDSHLQLLPGLQASRPALTLGGREGRLLGGPGGQADWVLQLVAAGGPSSPRSASAQTAAAPRRAQPE